MKKLIREPLLHFLLLGSVFFLIYQLTVASDSGGGDESLQIRISDARVEALAASFEKTWQRPPNESEIEGLVNNFVREEVFYREALALGLDRDDPVVRQRMAQKLRFLLEDLGRLEDPSDAELQSYLDANVDRYRRSPVFSLRQVYLNPSKRGASIEVDAVDLLSRLRAGEVSALDAGDATMLPPRYQDTRLTDIGRDLGREFATRLMELQVGDWQGPVESSFGLHLVFIEARIDSEVPELDEVRKAVTRDWASEKRQQANDTGYQELRRQYQVIREEPLSSVAEPWWAVKSRDLA